MIIEHAHSAGGLGKTVDIMQRCENTTEPITSPSHKPNHVHLFDQFLQAVRVEDYGAMLGLGLRHMTMVRIGGMPYELIAAQIAANCPEEIKRKNPEKLLRLAYELYLGGLADEYDALMREIAEMFPSLPMPEKKNSI